MRLYRYEGWVVVQFSSCARSLNVTSAIYAHQTMMLRRRVNPAVIPNQKCCYKRLLDIAAVNSKKS